MGCMKTAITTPSFAKAFNGSYAWLWGPNRSRSWRPGREFNKTDILGQLGSEGATHTGGVNHASLHSLEKGQWK